MRPTNPSIAGFYAVATAGLLWVPLLNVLHAEAGAAIAVLAFFVAGIDALAQFSKSERERPRVRTVVLTHLAYLLIPFAIYQLARIWLPACGFWVGVKFYVLFPVISSVLAVGIAFFLTGLRLRRVRLWFIVIAVGLMLGPVAYDLALHPQFYVYNHVFGGILGPIYDLELTTRSGLYWFRLMSLLWAVLAVLVGYALREPVRGGVLGMTMIAVALALLYANPGRFGYNTTYDRLSEELGSELRTAHFVLHFDSSSVSESEIEHLAADHEFRYFQLARRLGFEAELPIHSYLYPSASIRADLTGAGYTNIAPVWLSRPQVHVLLESYERSFTHELAHVFSREFGLPLLNTSLHVGLVEGFAVAVEPPDGLPSADDQVAAVVKSPGRAGVYGRGRVAEAVASALSPTGFWTGRGAVSYTTMGSFVDYLIRNFGVDKFARVYRLESFRSVYGQSVSSLASAWEREISARVVGPGVLDLAEARFSVLSLFERHCPHDVPRSFTLYKAAENRVAVGDSSGALVRLEQSMRSGPPVIEALDLWAKLKLARGDYEEIAPKLGAIWKSSEPYPAVLGTRLGDAHALAGYPIRAQSAYEGAVAATSPFMRGTRAILMLRSYASSRPDVIGQLVDNADPTARADSLSALADTTGATFVFAALLLAEAEQYRLAVDALKAAAGMPAAMSLGERYWAWLTAFAFRAGQLEPAERFRTLAVESALEAADGYQVARLEDFGDRISWAKTAGFE